MADKITIRRLGPEDAAVLDRVAPGTFDGPVRPDQAAAFLATDNHEIVVAIEDGTVVGMATGVVYLHPDKAPQFWINEIGVADARLRRGIGKRLLSALLKLAIDRGCDYAWLGTELENRPARALYRSLRGAETETLVTYEWDDLDDGLAVEEDDVAPGGA